MLPDSEDWNRSCRVSLDDVAQTNLLRVLLDVDKRQGDPVGEGRRSLSAGPNDVPGAGHPAE